MATGDAGEQTSEDHEPPARHEARVSEGFRELSSMLGTARTAPDIAAAVVRAARAILTAYTCAVVRLADADGSTIEVLAASPERAGRTNGPTSWAAADASALRALRDAQPVIADPDGERRWLAVPCSPRQARPDDADASDRIPCAIVASVAAGTTIARDVALLTTIGRFAAHALELLEGHEQARSQSAELEATNVFLQEQALELELANDELSTAVARAEAARARVEQLQRLTASLAEALEPAQVAASIVELAQPALGAMAAMVVMLSDDGEHLDLLRGSSNNPELLAWWEHYPLATASPVAESVRTRQVVAIPDDATLAERFPQRAPLLERLGVMAFYAAPLVAGDRTLGAFGLLWSTPQAFDDERLDFLRALARQASLGLERARLLRVAVAERAAAEGARERAERLRDLAVALSGALTTSEVAEVAVVAGARAVGAVGAVLTLLDAQGAVASRHAAPSTGSAAGAALPLLGHDDAGRSRTIGTLAFDFGARPPVGLERDAHVHAVAAACAQALERAQLYGAEREARVAADQARHEASAAASMLKQAQKMEAVGQLAGGVAHDFNNLLTVILANLEFVRHDLPAEIAPDAALREDLAEIGQAAERARALVRQLLTFSRQQPVTPRVVDVGAVVRDAERMLRRVIGEEVSLSVSVPAEPLHVLGDTGQLEQVLVNLAVNARDAMLTPAHGAAGRGGVLDIEVDAVAPGPEEAAAWDGTPPARCVRLRVRDTGHGMSDEVRAHLFEPFFTTKAVGRGTGLGLATVYGIVRQSGGDIRVESEVGHGSTFTVLLPAAEAPGDAGGDARAAEGADTRARVALTVLLVEDEAPVRAVARRILERRGHVVIEARHGGDALLLWREHAARIDLVVTDVRMPELGGRELVERLRAERAALPVVFASGYTDHAGDAAAGLAHAAFLAKPYQGEELVRLVESVAGAR